MILHASKVWQKRTTKKKIYFDCIAVDDNSIKLKVNISFKLYIYHIYYILINFCFFVIVQPPGLPLHDVQCNRKADVRPAQRFVHPGITHYTILITHYSYTIILINF